MKELPLKALFKKVTGEIILNSVLISVVAIVPTLTISFLSAERSKLELLTQQLAAVIKPKIQVGDEIEIRGILTKSLETSDVLWLSVSGNQMNTLVASKLSSRVKVPQPDESSYIDALTSKYIIQSSVFKIYSNDSRTFSIKVVYPNFIRGKVVQYTALTVLIISLALLLAIFARLGRLVSKISTPLESLKNYIERFDYSANEMVPSEAKRLSETRTILEKFGSLQDRIKQQNLDLIKRSVEEERGRVASQLGHDLKSYTSILLNMIETLRTKIGEDDLLILQRAASDISTKMQQLQRTSSESLESDEKVFVIQLAAYVAQVVEMKRIEYIRESRLNIRFDYSESDIDVFAKINPVEFRTAISNLVNNSVEAIKESGEIVLSVKRDDGRAIVVIRDTGQGIPKDQLDQLGKYGFSTKEGNGRGKGFTKAADIVRNDRGDILVDSELGVGTTIKLRFLDEWPRESNVGEINLLICKRAIVVDNDRTFAERLQTILAKKCPHIPVFIHNSFESFKSWAKTNAISPEDLVLMDYNLQESDQNRTGVNLIEMFALQERAILLTHNDADAKLLDECDARNIKLLPKILVEDIKFKVSPADEVAVEKYDGSVIDDNELHLINLKNAAKKSGLALRFYKRASEFLKDAHKLNPKKPIVIDSWLANGERGEIHAKHFYDELGFRDIILNTAAEQTDFQKTYPDGMYWIKGFVSKTEKIDKVISSFVS